MKLSEFKDALAGHPNLALRFVLPDGLPVPAHAHVTEVARVDKRFVDCGGTRREERHCRLQTWVAEDLDHRLHAGKLLKILDQAASLLGTEDLDVDVEHEVAVISQYPLTGFEIRGDELLLRLGTRHTACLAPELCCPPPEAPQSISFKLPARKP
ncbi:MAG: DUF6428 family protein [Verrucomicrobiota bacterium]